ncbi:MAG: SUMF1/EgtB/PvdO family nonheme iron enzyme [Myxococcales bacterium]|nr:SUMF1/EgtB/PvdO family nonheme iron enzyme [Myxococcales bacterium]
MAEIHINVGIVALARGFITLEEFAKGMSRLATGSAQSIRELWLGPNRLDEAQLAQVLDVIGPATGRDTMLFTAEPPKPFDPKQDSGPTQVGKAGPVKLLQVPVGTATAPTTPSMIPPIPVQSPPSMPMAMGGLVEVPTPAFDLLGSRYKKLFPLGSGGLGEVTACEDMVLGRTVAVKAGHLRGDVDSYSSKIILAREAKIISHLEHPNIIPIYDAGTDGTRGPYYVMRQVTDTSLEVILRRKRNGEGDPRDYTLGRLLRYFLQVCNAVDYAHHRGVIHCDIKPANILLGDYGEVLLVDWGLAQSRAHPLGVRGGTLGYMAPEQMDPTIERYDERTDVFGLGAILYEILAGKSAFPEVKSSDITTVGKDPLAMYQPPPLPSRVVPLDVPPEIEDICMRAIAIDRADRLANARMLADAIDEFIEGSKQKERKRIEADASADAGEELAERYHEFVESRPEKLNVYRSLRADIAPWADTDDKQDLWDAEDIVRVTDALQVRTFQSAVSAYERALDAVPNHTRARRGLARMFWSELQRARRRGDGLDEIAYEQLLREVDDGEFVEQLRRDGQLEVTIGEFPGRVTLAKLVDRDRRLVEGSVETIAERPVHKRTLPAGQYILNANVGERGQTIAWPISIDAGDACAITITAPATPLGENEVLIPGGRARLGGDPLSTETDEPLILDVPTFILQRHPVTFEQWFEFLDALRAKDPELVGPHLPRTTLGMPTWQRGGSGNWVPDASVPAIQVPLDPQRYPVFGISAESAEVYAAWLSERDGLTWRLPTEIEWEKAGRGTDGRVYPWGDHFDATFCKMRDSRPGPPLAEPIGAFLWDVSPYGVCDLAGGVADWCIPDPRRTAPREPREVVSRGGAWCDWPIDCRLASRRRYLATEHSARVGVRLARDP